MLRHTYSHTQKSHKNTKSETIACRQKIFEHISPAHLPQFPNKHHLSSVPVLFGVGTTFSSYQHQMLDMKVELTFYLIHVTSRLGFSFSLMLYHFSFLFFFLPFACLILHLLFFLSVSVVGDYLAYMFESFAFLPHKL